MPTPNTPELVGIYQHIKAHPEEWNQGYWATRTTCGTALCFAGHAVQRAGGVLAPDEWALAEFIAGKGHALEIEYADMPDGKTVFINDEATRILGLSLRQRDVLFYAVNTLDDLRRIITEITGVDPETADPVALAASVTP